jgi:hypothetical protein
MIRRGVLANIDAVEDLLDDDGPMNIQVKSEFLDYPVFLAVSPGGRHLDHAKPLSTNDLGDFFKRRCLAAGYPEHSTFYAWRRGAATTIDRATSRDTVRGVLGHNPSGQTFEWCYNNTTFDVDLFAISLSET